MSASCAAAQDPACPLSLYRFWSFIPPPCGGGALVVGWLTQLRQVCLDIGGREGVGDPPHESAQPHQGHFEILIYFLNPMKALLFSSRDPLRVPPLWRSAPFSGLANTQS